MFVPELTHSLSVHIAGTVEEEQMGHILGHGHRGSAGLDAHPWLPFPCPGSGSGATKTHPTLTPMCTETDMVAAAMSLA